MEITEAVERRARLIAFWHGQKIIGREDGETATVASRRGYGHWGHSAENYAKDHWHEYVSAAEETEDKINIAPLIGVDHRRAKRELRRIIRNEIQRLNTAYLSPDRSR